MTDAAIIYRSHFEAIENLPEEQQLSALKALIHYCLDDEMPEDGMASCVLMMARPVLDKWKSKREAGRKGGEADRKQTGSKPEANASNCEPKEKVKEKDKEKSTLTSAKRERFVPPSAEEVQEYCDSRNNGITGEEFVDFYASKGWKIGKESMKDWKAAVRTWEQKRKKTARSSPNKFMNFPSRSGEAKKENDDLKRRLLQMEGCFG